MLTTRLLFLDTLESPHKRPRPSRAVYELPIQPAITTVTAQDAGQRQLCVSYICARQAWLVARARKSMNSIKALDIAIRRLRKSRMPTVLAAGSSLADLLHDLVERQEDESAARILAFQSKLPRGAWSQMLVSVMAAPRGFTRALAPPAHASETRSAPRR